MGPVQRFMTWATPKVRSITWAFTVVSHGLPRWHLGQAFTYTSASPLATDLGECPGVSRLDVLLCNCLILFALQLT